MKRVEGGYQGSSKQASQFSQCGAISSSTELPVRTLTVSRPRIGRWEISHGRLLQTAYIITDVLFVILNSLFVFFTRFVPEWPPSFTHQAWPTVPDFPFVDEYLGFLLLYTALIVLCCQSQDLYRVFRTRPALDEAIAVARAVALATLLLTAFIYLSAARSVSRLVVAWTAILSMVCLAGWRFWRRKIVERRIAEGQALRNVLIVGAGRMGTELAAYLDQNKYLGYVVKGFVDSNCAAGNRVLGRTEEIAEIARAHFVDEVLITIPSEREVVKSVATAARQHHLEIKVIPDLYDGLGWRAPIGHLGDFPVMSLYQEPIPALGLFLKRIIDFSISLAALIILSPLLAVIAIAIKLDSPGPILYSALRVGKKGHRFICFKFRTMVVDAHLRKEELRYAHNERQGPTFKVANDPRCTRMGRILRKYSLDELPQFLNVLRGEMSLVGPRPHPVDDFGQYSLEHLRRLDVTPGITGLWQVTARQDPSFDTNMALDLEYIESWNLWLDAKILMRTIPAVLRGSGA